ncbi:MAG TPA: hypothetical protein VEU30_16485 [Thermoanaerobaculia bacterium]|nr:hypothetical protein [Thermoanaerobaculia bacterium]
MRKEDFYARTMHTPDDPARAAQRASLRDLWKQLLPLHRALIDAARDEYIARGNAVAGPTHLLQLLNEDAFFTWLKPLTAVIVDIDEMSRTDFERAQVDVMMGRVRQIFDGEAEAAFGSRYLPLLQRDVDVAIAHAAIRQILARLQG